MTLRSIQAVLFAPMLVAVAPAQVLLWFPVTRTVMAESDYSPLAAPPPQQQQAEGPGSGGWTSALSLPNPASSASMDLYVGQASSPTGDGLTCQQYAILEFQAWDEYRVAVLAESEFHAFLAVTVPADLTIVGELAAAAAAELESVAPGIYHANAAIEFRRVGDTLQFDQTVEVMLELGNSEQTQEHATAPIAWTASLPMGIYEAVVRVRVYSDEPFSWMQTQMPARCESALALTVSAVQTPQPAPCGGDLDADGDTDMLDFAIFQRCFNGPQP